MAQSTDHAGNHGLSPARILVVMGVSSSGKTTIGRELAAALAVEFVDADAYHPEANVQKMRAGHPLTDEDRWPWLQRYGQALAQVAREKGAVVGACSALRRAYRDVLAREAGEPVLIVYLDGSRELIAERIRRRHHDYMPASLLDSQFATLEEPQPDENALRVAIDPPVPRVVEDILRSVGGLFPA